MINIYSFNVPNLYIKEIDGTYGVEVENPVEVSLMVTSRAKEISRCENNHRTSKRALAASKPIRHHWYHYSNLKSFVSPFFIVGPVMLAISLGEKDLRGLQVPPGVLGSRIGYGPPTTLTHPATIGLFLNRTNDLFGVWCITFVVFRHQ
jgi:hypothetical protein